MEPCASLSPLIPEAAKHIQQKEMQERGRFIFSQHVECPSQIARTPTSVCEGYKAPLTATVTKQMETACPPLW